MPHEGRSFGSWELTAGPRADAPGQLWLWTDLRPPGDLSAHSAVAPLFLWPDERALGEMLLS